MAAAVSLRPRAHGGLGARRVGARRVGGPGRRLLGLAVAVSLVGCGRDPGGADPGAASYRRIQLFAGPVDVPAAVQLGSVTAEEQGDAWGASQGSRTALREVEGRTAFLAQRSGGDQWISVPIPAECSSFDRIVAELAAAPIGSLVDIWAAPFVSGVQLATWQSTSVQPGVEVVPRPFAFGRLADLPTKATEVRIRFGPGAKIGLVSKVSFLRGSITSDLVFGESDISGWSMAEVGGERRPATHVTSSHVATARFNVEKGEELEAAVAPDPRYLREGERLTFDFDIEVEGRPLGGEAARKTVSAPPGRWTQVRWPRDVIPPGVATLRVRVRSNLPNGLAIGWVDRPVLRRRAEGAPTVLLITSDTHRADHLGAVDGGLLVRTPHLDALAATGVLFTDCFSQTNVTNPSHISLMTGMHPRDTRIVDNRTRLSRAAVTLADRFADAGYATFASTSAQHLLDEFSGLGQGFDRMAGPEVSFEDGEIAVRRLVGWLREGAGTPTFAWLHVFDAHTPYGPPEPFDRRYYPKDKDPFAGSGPELHPSQIPTEMKGLRDIAFPAAQYRAEVDYLDHAMCELLELPRVRDGIVAFTADHGESLGEHGIWWGHSGVYPATVHVPLILRWPGCAAGTAVDAPVRVRDVAGTLLRTAGVERGPIEGLDLRGVAADDRGADVRYCLGSHAFVAAIQVDRWHLILELRPNFGGDMEFNRRTGQVELYDLEADPDCTIDLLLVEFETAKALRAKLIDWLSRPEGSGLAEASGSSSAAHEAMLRGLGYTEAPRSASAGFWDPEATCARDWATSPWNLLFSDPEYPRDEFRVREAAWAREIGAGARPSVK